MTSTMTETASASTTHGMGIDIQSTKKTVEGHTMTGTVYFENKKIWGPKSCHDNSVDIQRAFKRADPRFEMALERKPHSVEGHTRALTIKSNGNTILNGHSVHDNMDDMVATIKGILLVSPTP
ncbi:unnamed protein product [Clonostachys chloroleuca]|uniref:Uncharacterized protein n=1 Tax=Clonostachys chloroleuca TaxID=1926264 RepID=A0AA35M744_9HYPO|nr:unnamed protein product [Clonostachys chloroleuca]